VTGLVDPGLQPERTQLAWRRTALGFIVNAALVARWSRDSSVEPAAYVLVTALALTGLIALVRSQRLYAARNVGLPAGHPAARPRLVRALWAATTGATVTATVLVCVS
jgi:uncharacterized membrane protein YidH (DUF202 family)